MFAYFRQHFGAKIILGLLATVLLMAILGATAIGSQDQIAATLSDLTQNLEMEKTLSQNIVAELALMRFYTYKFVHEPLQENLDHYNEHFSRLDSLLAQSNEQVTVLNRQGKIAQIRLDVYQYGTTFNEVVKLTLANEAIVSDNLSEQTLLTENMMAALRIYINTLNEPKYFLIYGNGQNAYQLLRLNILQFIAQGDDRYTVLVNSNYHDTRNALSNLLSLLNDETQKKYVREVDQSIISLYNSFLEIRNNQVRIRSLFSEKLDVLDVSINESVNNMAAEIQKEFDQRNTDAQTLVRQTRFSILGTLIAIIFLILVLGTILSARTTNQLQQVMHASQKIANTDLASLASQMFTISQGDIRLQLDITTIPLNVASDDEIGQMARAFNEIVFRLQDTKTAFEQMTLYLNEMAGAARAVAAGNLNTDVNVRSDQDVLAKALVEMVRNLRSTQNKLLQQLSRLATLHSVDNMITKSQDLNATLAYLLEQAALQLEISAGEILFLDQQSGQLRPLARYGFPDFFTREDFKRSEKCAMLSIQNKQSQVIQLSNKKTGLEKLPFDTCISIPLVIMEKVSGVLQVMTISRMESNEDWRHYLETLAGQASIAIENHELVRGLEDRVAQRTYELQRSQRYYQALVNHSPVAIIVVDMDGNINSWNPAAQTLFGFTPEEVLGRELDEVVAAGDYYKQARAFSKISGKEFLHTFSQRKHKDGSIIAVEIFGEPITIEGENIGSLAIYHDITDLQRARQVAEEATRIKSEFLANMSHEIRTPMNGVIGMTNLLVDTRLTPLQRDYVETIRISAESLLIIINDILDFSKIEAGRMTLENVPFNLRSCTENALDTVAHQAASKHLELAYQMNSDVPEYVIGDETRLRQVLTNLLSNAVKFTENGDVLVRIFLEKELADFRPEPDEYAIHFAILDTGLGISSEQLVRLFQSFTQVDASTTRKFGGTGLGLAISKKLTELMSGKIWGESEGIPGKGSTFHFVLPFKPDPANQQLEHHTAHNLLLNKRILMVDDNPINCEILDGIVRKWDLIPVSFQSGREALAEIVQGKPFDLAVLDIKMPGMDGISLAKEIRKSLGPKQLPLMFLTSLGQSTEIPPEIKPVAFLQKPIKTTQLYAALLMALSETPIHVIPAPDGSKFDFQMASRHPLRILLAEDYAINQKVAVQTLERLGYQAEIAANGKEVVLAFERNFYDVVLMDAQMPEMDGVEATKYLRKNLPQDKQPWIIALTANALKGDREHYLEIGMDDYLSKPMHVEQLIKALENCTAGGHSKPHLVNEAPAHDQSERHTTFEGIQTSTADVEDLSYILTEQLSAALDLNLLNSFFPDFEQDIGKITTLIKMFLDDTPIKMEKLKSAANDNQVEKVRITAHTLKGSSLNFGAVNLSNLFKDLELLARSKEMAGAADILAKIEAEFTRVEISLKDLIML